MERRFDCIICGECRTEGQPKLAYYHRYYRDNVTGFKAFPGKSLSDCRGRRIVAKLSPIGHGDT